ncbi:MAG: hypothetical protein KatS3mg117_0753 [Geminicoccaceae bacterium]|jgi:hypothetical protein|nr:MAG: hypothetical protein KatS3mg117_0753 [Geminicoccaceae bacterium]
MPDGKRVLVFGESENDTKAIAELVRCLRSDLDVGTRREPIVLAKAADARKRKTNVEKIAAVVRADAAARPVHAVVLHHDCDAVEPAHVDESRRLETEAAATCAPARVVAATPAFELEAWWYLFPDAVAAYRPGWRRLARHGQAVGQIVNVKERLCADLRPTNPSKVKEYRESDSPGIAKKVRELGLCWSPQAQSASFDLFADKIRAL